MIQRIQSLFLIGSCFLNGGIYFTSLPKHIEQDPASWLSDIFIVLWVNIIFLCLITIFLFKWRIIQLIIIYLALLLEIFLFGFVLGITLSQGGIGSFLWDEVVVLMMILGCVGFLIGSIIRIRKDERLIRSLDRF